MGNAIKPHLENAQRTGVCQLQGMRLDEWPRELDRLQGNLRTLDLVDNRLSSVPSALARFLMLKSLNLSKNRIAVLPSEMGQLKKLETLILNCNRLTSLPESVGGLSNLRTVSIANNSLRAFPAHLAQLRHLDLLDLSRNKLSDVPDAAAQLQCVELNLNQNQISSLSPAIGRCPRLKVLRLEENCLDVNAFPPQLLRESQISLFAVEGNVFHMKQFHQLEGYEQYMERYSATRKKFN